MRLYVQDYTIQYFEILNPNGENDIACTMSVYYSFDKISSLDNVGYLPNFSLYVGTPMGISKYINNCIQSGVISAPISFFRFLIVSSDFNEKDIYMYAKNKLEGLSGKNANDIIQQAEVYFDWYDETSYERKTVG